MKSRLLLLTRILAFATILSCGPAAFATSDNFIPAPDRVDMVYDNNRDVVYITSGSSVLRYKISSGSFITPYTFNAGNLSGVDLSPDGNTLAIADRNMTGIHLVDLRTDTMKPDLKFTPSSGEGGSFTVAYGNDGSLLVTTQFNGSGWVPLRRIDPGTGAVTVISKGTSNPSGVRQDTMLSASADGRCIGYAESNSSDGPLGIYDVASQTITKYLQITSGTNAYNYEIGTNRDCSQFAVPTYLGTFVYDNSLTELGALGVYAGGQPISAAYHPLSDVAYFAWAGTSEVRAYDTKSYALLASFDVGYSFQNTGDYAFDQGRLKVSRDGALFFVTVGGGIAFRPTSLAPAAVSQSLDISASAPVAITLGAGSPKKLPLTYSIVSQPGHGSLTGTPPNLSYTPAAGYSGQDSFSFKASDGTLESPAATVTITIDTALPVITSFTLPASATSLSVPVTSLTAGDDHGVSGYCVSESSTGAGCTWTGAPPSSYRFSSVGTHTLYAFARDGAGNVSQPASATTVIPEIVPRITAFSIPASYGYDNPSVPVTLTASDDLGVTGYCVSESATPDGCAWNGWAPSSYTFSTLGPHTLYAFARNSNGKVSPPASAVTTVVGLVNFIPAPGRVDMVYDVPRGVLYVTSGTQVLRYQLATNSFLAPYTFGLGNLSGVDLSPDGNTLAVADRNITGVHLVDLRSDTVKTDVRWSPYISGEGGSFSVAYGKDGALLTTSTYNGSGWAPLRRVSPDGSVTIVKTIVSQDAMLSTSADGSCIGFVESNTSNGPLSIYDVATQSISNTISTDWFTYEVGTNRDCSQFAVPTYGGTFLYDESLSKLGTIGTYAAGQPIGVAYHPSSDVVYFAWAGAREVRAYDSKTLAQIGSYDAGYTFQDTGSHAFNQGRLKVARDGSLLFASVGGGIRYQRLGAGAVADNQTVTGYVGGALPITLTGSSSQNKALTFTVVTPPAHGSLTGSAPNLVYTPDPSYSGADTILFTVNDGTADSDSASLTINLKPIPGAVTVSPPAVKGELTLSWTDPAGPAFGCIRVYRSTAAGVLGGLVADNLQSTSYTDQGLASQTTYYYTVRVVDPSGIESTNTAQVHGTTLDSQVPFTTVTPAGGSYRLPQLVTMVTSEPATIYYTTDGSTPGTGSPEYGGPITISSNTVLKFFAVDTAGNAEAVRTAYYVVNPLSLPSKIMLTLSAQGTTRKIGAILATVTLPPGVTVQADATGIISVLDSGPVALSGGWALGGQIAAHYTPAQTGTTGVVTPATVRVVVISAIGQDAGLFATVTCDVAPGTVADVSSFPVTVINAVDTGGSAISGLAGGMTLSADLTPPTLAVSTLPDHAVTTNATLNVTGKASDDSGIASLGINGVPVPVAQDGSFSAAVILAGGANTVTTVAVDGTGNQSVDTRVITLDNTAPQVSVSAPADNVTVSGTWIAVTGTVDPSATVEVRANGVAAQTVSHNGAAYLATVNLVPGLNTIEVIASDLAGKKSTIKRSVISGAAGPSISITAPQQDLTTCNQTVTVRGTVDTSVSTIGYVTVNVDGKTYTSQLVAGSFSLDIPLPVEKVYQVTVTATDQGGIASSVQRNIVYKWAPGGDLNGDGEVGIADALKALRIAVKLDVATDLDLANGDVAPLGVDGRPASDGQIDISDALLILKKAVGLASW